MLNQQLFEALQSADAVVVGAGAGLSTSAGIEEKRDLFRALRNIREPKPVSKEVFSCARSVTKSCSNKDISPW